MNCFFFKRDFFFPFSSRKSNHVTDCFHSLLFFCSGAEPCKAPEALEKIFLFKGICLNYHKAEPATVWTLGTLLYEMVTGEIYLEYGVEGDTYVLRDPNGLIADKGKSSSTGKGGGVFSSEHHFPESYGRRAFNTQRPALEAIAFCTELSRQRKTLKQIKEVRCSFNEFSKPLRFCSNLAETIFNIIYFISENAKKIGRHHVGFQECADQSSLDEMGIFTQVFSSKCGGWKAMNL